MNRMNSVSLAKQAASAYQVSHTSPPHKFPHFATRLNWWHPQPAPRRLWGVALWRLIGLALCVVLWRRDAQIGRPYGKMDCTIWGSVRRILFLFGIVLATSSIVSEASAQQAQTVPEGFALKPAAIAAASSFRLLFVTTQTFAAQSGDISTYNTHVQTSAGGGHAAIQPFSNEFRALISTRSVDARDNTATNNDTGSDTDAPIYWLNGAKVADDYTDFYDGDWDSVAGRDRNGNSYTHPNTLAANRFIWTGSNSNGTESNGAGSRSVGIGRLMLGQEFVTTLRGANALAAASPYPLYALSPILTLNQAPTVSTIIPDQLVSPGDDYTYTFPANTFADADSDSLTYSAVAIPTAPWLTFSTASRTFSGTLPAAGVFTITVTASDGIDEITDEFTVTVVPRPSQAQTVPADFALKPAAIAAGGSFRLLYVTTATATATSADIATYNTHVQTSAGSGHSDIQLFSSEFRALISTATVDARDNTATNNATGTDTDAPIYWLDGAKVADDYTDFYDGNWDSMTATDRAGDTYSFAADANDPVIWTGSASNGTESNGAGSASVGIGRLTLGQEFVTTLRGTNALAAESRYPLYALSPILTRNQAPTVSTIIPDQLVSPGDDYTYTFPANTFADADSDPLTYSAVAIPTAPWLTFSTASRTFSGTLPAAGVFTITVTASDGIDEITDEFTVTVVPLPSQAQTVPADFALKPAAIAAGGSFRLLYVTTATATATSADIATYNTHVQTSAGSGHSDIQLFSSEFRALISTATVDARDNTATNNATGTDTDAPIYWLDGAKVADDYTDFYDGNWDSIAATDRDGGTYSFAADADVIWTGSDSNGTESNGAGSASVGIGRLTTGQEIAAMFMGSSNFSPDSQLPLYALSPLLTLERTDLLFKIKVFLEGAQ